MKDCIPRYLEREMNMRILFISANREEINMPVLPMGMGCVAEATRQSGHEVKLVDLMSTDDFHSLLRVTIDDFQPDVIAVSVRNVDDQNMAEPKFLLKQAKEVVDECRKISEATIVLGGAGYSIFPDTALAYIGADMGVQGEGEVVFPMLLERLASRRDLSGLPGLFLPGKGAQGRKAFINDLDTLPFPTVDLFQIHDAGDSAFLLPFQTRRGCPLNCSYCSTATIEGRRLRYRSAERVVRELGLWRDAGISRFFFVDNTFNLPPSYALALCELISQASLDISWRCILYPGNVSENLIREMAGAGCREVSLGFESGCQKILDGFNKHFKTDEIERTSKMLADYGIRQMGFLLLGGPGETKQTVEESLKFVESLPMDALKITMGIRIYPGTKLSELAIKEGCITSESDLLHPRFYMRDELADWLRQTLRKWQTETNLMVMMDI
jgi:radical SAM superfamily enzyme YgiQ (UPF0313 family)